jgi:hypothetical protein
MNTNDVERRLEALASASADPDLPPAILDQLARLEAGSDLRPVHVGEVRRQRTASGRNARRLMVLGLAATLALTGGLIYAVATQNKPGPSPTPSVALGPWQQVNDFGPIVSSQFQSVSLTWQNDEIVGVANGKDRFDLYQSCVLESPDGTVWTCDELPKPADFCTTYDPCLHATSIAVSGGRWAAMGYVTGPGQQLMWTSPGGGNWVEQPSAREGFYQGSYDNTIDSPHPHYLMATSYGFVRSGVTLALPDDANALMTSVDGAHWQPAELSAGSSRLSSASLGYDPKGGYLALGYCVVADPRTETHVCAASSRDGRVWTTSEPAASAAAPLVNLLRTSVNPAYRDGRWVAYLTTQVTHTDTGVSRDWFEITSPDGINWSMSPTPIPKFVEPTISGLPVFSLPGPSGTWAINSSSPIALPVGTNAYTPPPVTSPTTYWSATGLYWQPVAGAPAGVPLAVVETPSQLVEMVAVYPDGDFSAAPDVSVWAAAKH